MVFQQQGVSNKAPTFKWEDDTDAHETLPALLLLPVHLQRAFFVSVAVCRRNRTTVSDLLADQPEALHGPLISSQVSPKGELDICLKQETSLFVAAIHASQLHLPSPGIVSLQLESCSSVTSAGMLAAAVASHTALTHLFLDGLSPRDQSTVPLFQQLHVLRHLQHLYIIGCRFAGPAGLAGLAHTFACLSEITHLGMATFLCPLLR